MFCILRILHHFATKSNFRGHWRTAVFNVSITSDHNVWLFPTRSTNKPQPPQIWPEFLTIPAANWITFGQNNPNKPSHRDTQVVNATPKDLAGKRGGLGLKLTFKARWNVLIERRARSCCSSAYLTRYTYTSFLSWNTHEIFRHKKSQQMVKVELHVESKYEDFFTNVLWTRWLSINWFPLGF